MLAARLSALTATGSENEGQELKEILGEIALLPASSVVRAGREIAISARLAWPELPRQVTTGIWAHLRQLLWARPEPRRQSAGDPSFQLDILKTNSDYAWLFLFYPNGYLREAALNCINAAPQSPFFLTALALRLNDWAEPVRHAAKRCIERVSPQISTAIAADAAFYLLDRRFVWGRWGDEASSLDPILGRDDVLAALAERLRSQADGAMAASLRHLLRYPGSEDHLPMLAARAVQPLVRAVAYQSLITGKASWRVGYKWIWDDKAYGVKSLIPNFETRTIKRERSPLDYIAEGICDKSAFVRKTVADAVITVRRELPIEEGVITILTKDRNAAVRSRADFMLRHPVQNGSHQVNQLTKPDNQT